VSCIMCFFVCFVVWLGGVVVWWESLFSRATLRVQI